MNIRFFLFKDDFDQRGKREVLSVLHWVACIFGALITLYLLVMVYATFTCALQDVHKFEHTGTFLYFLHFLDEYNFLGSMCTFLLMLTELILYVLQYRRADLEKPFRYSSWYFFIMLVIHVVIWLHANSLSLPENPALYEAKYAGLRYSAFARRTVLPPVIYFVMYFLHTLKSRLIGNT